MSLLLPAPPDALSRTRVGVRVGGAGRAGVGVASSGRGGAALVCVALCPPGAPWLADLFPGALVRATRERDPRSAVEHLRLAGRDRAELLPGLEGPSRSRLRDALRLALAAGAPAVDLVAVRAGDRPPWRVLDPEVQEAVDPFLAELSGAVLLYPDFCGPEPVGPGTAAPMEERLAEGLVGVTRAAARWAERTQVALLDHPGAQGEHALTLLRALHGADAALCRWTGDPAALARHGWRSAAAVVGGGIGASPEDYGRSLEGSALALAPGRAGPPSRRGALLLRAAPPAPLEGDEDCVTLALRPGLDQATVLREPTLRAPIGAWSLTALRLVKAVHRHILETAERFVFQLVDDAMAIALTVSLQRALQDFARRGLLTGPGGDGPPQVKGGALRSPDAPGLSAVIAAQIRPWSQAISVRVTLRPGAQPTLEASWP